MSLCSLWDLITNESEALNWLGQKVQAPQIQPEDTSEMKKEEGNASIKQEFSK